MSFNDKEMSIEDAGPIELYRFSRGEEIWRYTSAGENIRTTVGVPPFPSKTQTWFPRAISSSAIEQAVRDSPPRFTVSMPWQDDMLLDFQPISPTNKLTLRMFRTHAPDSTLRAHHWTTGHVMAIQIVDNGTTAKLTIIGDESDFVREIPRLSFSRQCPYVLGDTRCGVDFDEPLGVHPLKTVETVATQETDRTVTFASELKDFTFFDAIDWFTGGEMVYDGTRRLILKHEPSTGVITLLQSFPAAVIGERVTLFAGCNHLMGSPASSNVPSTPGHCHFKFKNSTRYGGWPWIPTKNPSEDFLYLKP